MADLPDDLLGMPPLDLGETMAPQSPPQSQPSAKNRAKDFAPLLALLPIVAAKGGQAGVAALLQGFSQARQQGDATARQTQQDAERQRQVQEQERIRRATLQQNTQNDAAMRRQQFMTTFQNGLQSETLDSPEAVRAFMEFYRPQAQSLGLRPDALDAVTMEAMTPTRFEKKEANKVIEAARKQYGDQAVSHTYTLKDGTQANWEELNRRSGVTLGAATPEKTDLSKSSLDVQAAAALAAGDTATYARLKKVADEMSGARRADAPGPGAPNPRMDARVDRIVNSFNAHPIVKEYNEVQSQLGIIKNVVTSGWSGPGDMAIVFAFMKALDPNSVVRETEYENAAKSGNIFQGWAARFNGAINPAGGFLSERVRQDFLRTINSRMDVKGKQYQNLRKQLVSRVDRIKAGAPETGDEALINYETGAEPEAPPPTSTPRADSSRNRVLPPPQSGPRIGERRTFNGQVGEWDGTGWKAVRP